MGVLWSFGEKAYAVMSNSVLRSFHGNHDLAHDAAVETWLAAVRKGEEAFESEGALIGYCLFKVGKMAIDLKRRDRAISGREASIEEVAGSDESDRLWDQARVGLAKAEAGLTEFERQIVDLYYYESLSDREIAQRLMTRTRGGDAQRKSIYRARQSAVKRMAHFFLESGLDYEAVFVALDSRN